MRTLEHQYFPNLQALAGVSLCVHVCVSYITVEPYNWKPISKKKQKLYSHIYINADFALS